MGGKVSRKACVRQPHTKYIKIAAKSCIHSAQCGSGTQHTASVQPAENLDTKGVFPLCCGSSYSPAFSHVVCVIRAWASGMGAGTSPWAAGDREQGPQAALDALAAMG